MSKTTSKNSRWIAAGADATVMAALCEHLTPAPVIVTTRADLLAQMEAGGASPKKLLLLLDDSLDVPSLPAGVQTHIIYLKTPSGGTTAPKASTAQVVDKPIRIFALQRQVRHLLSQFEEGGETAVSALCTLLKSRQLLTNPNSGAQAELTEKEAQILDFLGKVRPEAASREELHREVWGYQGELNTHTLETHIYRLRSKLKEIGALDVSIESTASGYKLSAA